MLTEKQYRETVKQITRDHLESNDFILALAMAGLVLVPEQQDGVRASPPFDHYVLAREAVWEIDKHGLPLQAWPSSWIVDFDYKEHKRPKREKFVYPPINPLE